MKRKAKKAVSYSKSFKSFVVNEVLTNGISIASVCMQQGIDEVYQVREWVREDMKKRGLLRIPKTLTKRKKAPLVMINEPINHQFQRYEEIIMYQQSLIEALYAESDQKTKKKLLEQLSPTQQRRLKQTGKL
jgi:transposase-like protein